MSGAVSKERAISFIINIIRITIVTDLINIRVLTVITVIIIIMVVVLFARIILLMHPTNRCAPRTPAPWRRAVPQYSPEVPLGGPWANPGRQHGR